MPGAATSIDTFRSSLTDSASSFLAAIDDDADNYYEMCESLGEGQFGEVFRAEHKTTGKVVAVKFINRQQTRAVAIDAITAQEIEVMLRIDHPNCVKLYEIYQTNTEIQLVMELLEGGDLFDRIKSNRKFPEGHAREMMRQICDGVKYLHDRKIIHRDLKPENILLVHPDDSAIQGPEKWAVKVADFGRSKLFPEEVPDMHTQTRCGTPGYAAPEVLLHEKYGEKIDCWGCGILAYIMLSGAPPFPLNMKSGSVSKVTSGRFSFPNRHWGQISAEAHDFIRKMLIVDADKRMSMSQALEHPWFTSVLIDKSLQFTGVPINNRSSDLMESKGKGTHAADKKNSVQKGTNKPVVLFPSSKDSRGRGFSAAALSTAVHPRAVQRYLCTSSSVDSSTNRAAGSGSGLEFTNDQTEPAQRAANPIADDKNPSCGCCVIA